MKKEMPKQISLEEGLKGIREIENQIRTSPEWQQLFGEDHNADMLIASLVNGIEGIGQEELQSLQSLMLEWKANL